jgi:hypothetical protein
MKIIRFFSKKEFVGLGQPLPAKKFIPQWYKDSEMVLTDKDGNESPGLKRCIPFLDSMLSGYMFVTPFDIFVGKKEDGTLSITWNGPESFNGFIAERTKDLGEKMPRPPGHWPTHLAFRITWGVKTPRGWSLLVTTPFNRHDLPWTLTSGIMDADKYSTSGNLPFFMKEGFTGMIPAGTPVAQLIPIKRASWNFIMNDEGIRYLDDLQGATVRTPGKSYKKLFWQRKDYS